MGVKQVPIKNSDAQTSSSPGGGFPIGQGVTTHLIGPFVLGNSDVTSTDWLFAVNMIPLLQADNRAFLTDVGAGALEGSAILSWDGTSFALGPRTTTRIDSNRNEAMCGVPISATKAYCFFEHSGAGYLEDVSGAVAFTNLGVPGWIPDWNDFEGGQHRVEMFLLSGTQFLVVWRHFESFQPGSLNHTIALYDYDATGATFNTSATVTMPDVSGSIIIRQEEVMLMRDGRLLITLIEFWDDSGTNRFTERSVFVDTSTLTPTAVSDAADYTARFGNKSVLMAGDDPLTYKMNRSAIRVVRMATDDGDSTTPTPNFEMFTYDIAIPAGETDSCGHAAVGPPFSLTGNGFPNSWTGLLSNTGQVAVLFSEGGWTGEFDQLAPADMRWRFVVADVTGACARLTWTDYLDMADIGIDGNSTAAVCQTRSGAFLAISPDSGGQNVFYFVVGRGAATAINTVTDVRNASEAAPIVVATSYATAV